MKDELKYRLLWQIGNVISLGIYYSGLSHIYTFCRRHIYKQHRTVALTYHRVRDDNKSTDIRVTTKSFNAQIQYLKKKFKVISMRDAVSDLSAGTAPECDRVAITFDDGYKDNFQNAFPILRKHRCPATIFLVSSLIGQSREILTIKEIREMAAAKIEFGSHTVNHPILSDLKEDQILNELRQSKSDLEHLLGLNIHLFAYPKGKKKHYTPFAIRTLRQLGYTAALTTENGALEKSNGPYELNRIGIRECPLYVFKVRLSGIFESKLVFILRQFLHMT